MPSWMQRILDWGNENPGTVMGILIGAAIFIILVIFGPLILVFVLFVGGGYIVGRSLDENVSVSELIRGWLAKMQRHKNDLDDDF